LTVFCSEMPGFQLAGIDAAEGQRTDERVVHDLERQHRQRRIVGLACERLFFGLHVDALDGGTSIGLGR
jgi:hypothetical protein